ncbi:hypothetical protein, unlikely [Trypanosoma brucei gambiense DAL972]|uniref:Uncharacterized protein n=1 Tax=Trypanosoma brucei gambiense (strain MHOM/CI/86/DAL972) TaxID=679716 RepID=C9ZPJ7_TRYB9|nr:hypothetical protein, unlikely [Trypanosoma brucei gambiense DAL972]CBH11325.1 hypothetical protein, unlikely [Trypanosoma brucei gambiense DAL972]|eukprot:XP_011773612.1 hypothetical protein, unlikely [Trypanosoma brucei gambiense DAL972]
MRRMERYLTVKQTRLFSLQLHLGCGAVMFPRVLLAVISRYPYRVRVDMCLWFYTSNNLEGLALFLLLDVLCTTPCRRLFFHSLLVSSVYTPKDIVLWPSRRSQIKSVQQWY